MSSTRYCKYHEVFEPTDNFERVSGKNGKIYFRNICRESKNLLSKPKKRAYYNKNKDSIIEKNQQYKVKNREETNRKQRQYYQATIEIRREYRKKYYKNNKKTISKQNSLSKKKNKTKINQKNRDKRATDLKFKIRELISCIVRKSIKNKSNSISNWLSYSLQELMSHLESQFEPWMNWQNHGKYNPVTWNDNDSSTWTWQIDHIIPQSDLPYTSMEDENFKICWSLSNLRPYSAKLNILDGSRRSRHVF